MEPHFTRLFPCGFDSDSGVEREQSPDCAEKQCDGQLASNSPAHKPRGAPSAPSQAFEHELLTDHAEIAQVGQRGQLVKAAHSHEVSTTLNSKHTARRQQRRR